MLQELPAKPKDELSLKEAIAKMYEYITSALNRGYSHAEISEVLKGQGLQISSSTLKSYLAQVKPSDTPRRAKQPRKPKAEASSKVISEVVPEVESESSVSDDSAVSESPKRGGRKPAASQKTAAKAAAKPATIALDVPESSEPPKRGRKAATDESKSAAVKTSTRRRSAVGRGRKEHG